MLQCIQAFVETLDSRCAEGKGSAIVDIYTILGNLTSVGEVESAAVDKESANEVARTS
jgi:hypothetical protein